jgi:hypothetical protein
MKKQVTKCFVDYRRMLNFSALLMPRCYFDATCNDSQSS